MAAKHHKSTLRRREELRRLAAELYEDGNQAKCYAAIWRSRIYPAYGVCYRTFLHCIHSDREASDGEHSDRNGSDRNATDRESSNRNSSDRNATDGKPSDRNSSDRNASGGKPSNRNSSDRKAFDRESSNRNGSDENPSGRGIPAPEKPQLHTKNSPR